MTYIGIGIHGQGAVQCGVEIDEETEVVDLWRNNRSNSGQAVCDLEISSGIYIDAELSGECGEAATSWAGNRLVDQGEWLIVAKVFGIRVVDIE